VIRNSLFKEGGDQDQKGRTFQVFHPQYVVWHKFKEGGDQDQKGRTFQLFPPQYVVWHKFEGNQQACLCK
jgi:hypothetical protein